MTSLLGAAVGAEVAAAVTGVLLARRRPEHRPAAVALALFAVFGVAMFPLLAALTPLPRPVEGAARALVYLDGALVLGAAAVTPGLALAVSVSPERRRLAVALVLGAWALASLVLGALYPSPLVRGEGLQRVYLATDLIGLAISIVVLLGWARRTMAAGRWSGSAPMVAIGLVLLDLGILLVPYSPWRGSLFAGRFDVVQVGIVIFFAAFAAVQGVLWRFSKS